MTDAKLALLLDFDGTIYTGDLPLQSYARHVAETLPDAQATALIAGMRGYLEGRTDFPQAIDLAAAEDGYHAIVLLAQAAEVPAEVLQAAYQASRADLAASAFAVEAADGLVELLTRLAPHAFVQVVTNADPVAVYEVLHSIGVAPLVDEVLTGAGKPDGMPDIVASALSRIGGRAERLLAVGDRWAADLGAAKVVGGATAYIDRFGRGDGEPTWRGADLASLIPQISNWADRFLAGDEDAGGGDGGPGSASGDSAAVDASDEERSRVPGDSAAVPAAPTQFPGPHLQTPDGMPAERPTLTIAHLSDTHLTSVGLLYNTSVDARAALNRAATVLEAARDLGRGVDVVVVSGDLTDSGDPEAYQHLRHRLESVAPLVIYATGNHDVRTAFHTEILGLEEPGPLLQVHLTSGMRVIVLDSTIPGAGHGRLSPAHLAELAAELSSPNAEGTVVVLHHAPIPPPSPLLTYFALERSSRQALQAVLAESDTRLILAGHHHLAGSGMLGSIPVAVAGSTAIWTDPLAPVGHERTTRSASFNLVRVYPETITVSVVPIDGAEQVFDLDAESCAAIIAAHLT